MARSCSSASIASLRSAGAGHASVACEARAAACCSSSALGTRPVIARHTSSAYSDGTRGRPSPISTVGKRHVQPRLGGADREPQLQLLELRALGLRRQAGVELRRARRRAAADPRAASAETSARRAPARTRRRTCGRAAARGCATKHAAVAPRRRLGLDAGEPIGEHARRFVERDRPDRAHRPQVGEHAQHAVGPAQHARRERREDVEPLRPRRLHRPRGQQSA